jgi:hypothetical protein
MSNNNLSVDDLVNYYEKKSIQRQEKYMKLLKICHDKIKIATKIKLKFCWFTIPVFLDGIMLNDEKILDECVCFIKEKLKEGGFDVNFYKPNIMYISWNIRDTKSNK